MTIALWVARYPVTYWPRGHAVRYGVFQGSAIAKCPDACQHIVEGGTLAEAKKNALTLHQRGINCRKSAAGRG